MSWIKFGGALAIGRSPLNRRAIICAEDVVLWTQPRPLQAHNGKLKSAIADGEPVRFADVEINETTTADKLPRWMEKVI